MTRDSLGFFMVPRVTFAQPRMTVNSKRLRDETSVRDARWSEAVEVGSLAFVEKVKSELEFKAAHRQVIFRIER